MSIGRYAKNTDVSVDRSIGELRTIIARYGASDVGIFTGETMGGVMFAFQGRKIKMSMPMPTRESVMTDSLGRKLRFSKERFEKAHKQRWRALLLVVKAKLEGIESGIETFEQAFMPYLLLPDGKTTVGEAVIGQIQTGTLKLLGGGS